MKSPFAVLLLLAVAACATSRGKTPATPPGPDARPAAPPTQGAKTAGQPTQGAKTAGQPAAIDQDKDKDKTDDWEYVRPKEEARMVGGVVGGVPGGVVGGVVGGLPGAPPPPSPTMAPRALGFATGGAKDVGNFRENIRAGYLPLPTDIPYEGLFYDYYFDTGAAGKCERLFCPSYVAAVSPDPISRKNELFLSVGLNSGLDAAQFSRKRLNLVVVLDISGSMGSPFDEYYYDRFGNKQEPAGDAEEKAATKLRIATRSIVNLLSHLKDDDRLGIVLFDDVAYRAKRVRELGLTDRQALNGHLLELQAGASTNMEAGMQMAVEMLAPFRDADRELYENRIIFLTDAMPNTGRTGDSELLEIARRAAGTGVYSTFIGIGVDFNTELVSAISRVRGANYYSVHSAGEFRKRLDEEFEFMVTPLVFDLELRLETSGYEIVAVYGSPEETGIRLVPNASGEGASGEILKVNTLFPSKVEEGQTRGGVVLLQLRQQGQGGRLALTASYQDRSGRFDRETRTVVLPAQNAPVYPTTGVRKAILLSRYADLLRNWASDEGVSRVNKRPIAVSVSDEDGIRCPPIALLGRWERQSLPLSVSPEYRAFFARFLQHFRAEAAALGDPTLDKEVKVLERLAGGGKPPEK